MAIRLGEFIKLEQQVVGFHVDGVPLSSQTLMDSRGLWDRYREIYGAKLGKSIQAFNRGDAGINGPESIDNI